MDQTRQEGKHWLTGQFGETTQGGHEGNRSQREAMLQPFPQEATIEVSPGQPPPS